MPPKTAKADTKPPVENIASDFEPPVVDTKPNAMDDLKLKIKTLETDFKGVQTAADGTQRITQGLDSQVTAGLWGAVNGCRLL